MGRQVVRFGLNFGCAPKQMGRQEANVAWVRTAGTTEHMVSGAHAGKRPRIVVHRLHDCGWEILIWSFLVHNIRAHLKKGIAKPSDLYTTVIGPRSNPPTRSTCYPRLHSVAPGSHPSSGRGLELRYWEVLGIQADLLHFRYPRAWSLTKLCRHTGLHLVKGLRRWLRDSKRVRDLVGKTYAKLQAPLQFLRKRCSPVCAVASYKHEVDCNLVCFARTVVLNCGDNLTAVRNNLEWKQLAL